MAEAVLAQLENREVVEEKKEEEDGEKDEKEEEEEPITEVKLSWIRLKCLSSLVEPATDFGYYFTTYNAGFARYIDEAER
ncbi:hypothetical protein RND71_036853 [Anisodus tanguticus]|uniref:Uncharacterized protein n=1 Tax=Anisodus tanguticus TaxID=243964 RepID=A0AAE1R2Y9_9SOLA|nr:hypothetical protein RND71_036853 [Anisodus tanguticus]